MPSFILFAYLQLSWNDLVVIHTHVQVLGQSWDLALELLYKLVLFFDPLHVTLLVWLDFLLKLEPFLLKSSLGKVADLFQIRIFSFELFYFVLKRSHGLASCWVAELGYMKVRAPSLSRILSSLAVSKILSELVVIWVCSSETWAVFGHL